MSRFSALGMGRGNSCTQTSMVFAAGESKDGRNGREDKKIKGTPVIDAPFIGSEQRIRF